VNQRMEATVDPKRNNVCTALTITALTARMKVPPKPKRQWGEGKLPTDSNQVAGLEKDGLRMIEDAHKERGINLTKLQGTRDMKFKQLKRTVATL